MLAADEDLANRIVEMAQRRGQTVFQTVNDILAQALRVDDMGLLLDDVVDERGMLEKAKSLGLTFTIESLLYDVVDLAHSNAQKNLSELWYEVGQWYGKYFDSRSSDGVESFGEAMSLLNLGDSVYNVDQGKGNSVSVSCVGERFTAGFTEVYGLFIEGVFDSLGMELVEKENSKGILRLKFQQTE